MQGRQASTVPAAAATMICHGLTVGSKNTLFYCCLGAFQGDIDVDHDGICILTIASANGAARSSGLSLALANDTYRSNLA